MARSLVEYFLKEEKVEDLDHRISWKNSILSRFGFFTFTYTQAAVLRPSATLNSLFSFLMVPYESKKNSRIVDGETSV